MKSLIALLIVGSAASLIAADAPVDAATEPAAKPYPLQTCIVSDEALGSMGKPVVIVHDGQEVKFCCRGCVKKFTRDPAAFLPKLAPEAVPPATPAAGNDGP